MSMKPTIFTDSHPSISNLLGALAKSSHPSQNVQRHLYGQLQETKPLTYLKASYKGTNFMVFELQSTFQSGL